MWHIVSPEKNLLPNVILIYLLNLFTNPTNIYWSICQVNSKKTNQMWFPSSGTSNVTTYGDKLKGSYQYWKLGFQEYTEMELEPTVSGPEKIKEVFTGDFLSWELNRFRKQMEGTAVARRTEKGQSIGVLQKSVKLGSENMPRCLHFLSSGTDWCGSLEAVRYVYIASLEFSPSALRKEKGRYYCLHFVREDTALDFCTRGCCIRF